jgi:sporulation protein YlmC with PRC-barrel domain
LLRDPFGEPRRFDGFPIPTQLESKMNYEERDPHGMYKGKPVTGPGPDSRHGPGPHLMGADSLVGNDVYNKKSEDLGEIKEIMLDMRSGRVSYAVLSFGTFLGMGGKLFAVPWEALKLDTKNKRFVLDVSKDQLQTAPGFDKDHWPNMADPAWEKGIREYYGILPGSDTSHH